MLELAFDFPEKYAKEQNINIVLFLDGARKAFALETLLRNGSINLMCKRYWIINVY